MKWYEIGIFCLCVSIKRFNGVKTNGNLHAIQFDLFVKISLCVRSRPIISFQHTLNANPLWSVCASNSIEKSTLSEMICSKRRSVVWLLHVAL